MSVKATQAMQIKKEENNLMKCLPKSALQQNEQKQVLRKLSNRRGIYRVGSVDRTAVDSTVQNDHSIVCFTIMDILSDTIKPLSKYGCVCVCVCV